MKIIHFTFYSLNIDKCNKYPLYSYFPLPISFRFHFKVCLFKNIICLSSLESIVYIDKCMYLRRTYGLPAIIKNCTVKAARQEVILKVESDKVGEVSG